MFPLKGVFPIAETIRGINVLIGSDTTGLQKALGDVNKNARDIQEELKQVEKLLKLDPTNTELLAQKQKLLSDAVANTGEKLNRLKAAQEQVNDQFKKGEINEGQYRAFQREVAKSEQELNKLESQAVKVNAVLSKDDAVKNLKNIGLAAGAAAIAAGAVFVGLTGKAIENADELQRLSDVTGLSAERLQELKYAGNNLGVELDTITGAQSKLTKAMFAAKDGTGAQADAFKALGISVVDSNGQMRDAKTVMEEAFTALNGVGNETERDALAMQLFGKSAMEMNPLIKAGGDELNRLAAEARSSGAVMSTDAVAGLDAFGDTLDNLKTSIMGSFGEKLNEMLPQIREFLNNLVALPQWIQENSTMLELIGVAIGAVTALIITFNVQQLLLTSGMTLWGIVATGATAITTALGAAFAFLTSPIALVILAIAAAVAAGVLLYKNWDTITAKAQELWSGITQAWEGVTAATSAAWNSVEETISNIWTSISTSISTALNAVKTGISNTWNAIKTVSTNIWHAITNVVMTIINNFVTGITNIFNSMKNGLGMIMQGLSKVFSGAWDAIKNIFLGAVLLIMDLVTGDFTKLKEDAGKIFENLKEDFVKIWDGIKLIFTGTVKAISGFLILEWNGIKSGAITIWSELKSFFQTLWTDMKTALTTAWTNMKTSVINLCDDIKTGAINIWNGILDFFRNLPGTLYDLAVNMFTSMKNGVINTVYGVKTAIVKGISEAINWIEALPEQALQWGQDIVQGLVDGIKAKIQSVIDVTGNVCEAIKNGVRNILGIRSPSTVMTEYGEDISQGLADGINNRGVVVASAAGGLATTISTAMQGIVSSVGSASTQINTFVQGLGSYVDELGNLIQTVNGFPVIKLPNGNWDVPGIGEVPGPGGQMSTALTKWKNWGGIESDFYSLHSKYKNQAEQKGWTWFYIMPDISDPSKKLYFRTDGSYSGTVQPGDSETSTPPPASSNPSTPPENQKTYSPSSGWQGPGKYGPFGTTPQYRVYNSENEYLHGAGQYPPAYMKEGGITTKEGLIYTHPQEAIMPLMKLPALMTDALAGAIRALSGDSAQVAVPSIAVTVTGNHIQSPADENRLADKVSRRIAQQFGLSTGGAF